jgi:hypothetical protein
MKKDEPCAVGGEDVAPDRGWNRRCRPAWHLEPSTIVMTILSVQAGHLAGCGGCIL